MANCRTLTFMILPVCMLGGCDKLSGTEKTASCTMAGPVAAPTTGTPTRVDSAQITQRSVSTIVEQLSFQLCTARINRWIDDQYYRQEMTALRKASFLSLGVKLPEEPTDPAAQTPETPPSTSPENTNAF